MLYPDHDKNEVEDKINAFTVFADLSSELTSNHPSLNFQKINDILTKSQNIDITSLPLSANSSLSASSHFAQNTENEKMMESSLQQEYSRLGEGYRQMFDNLNQSRCYD